MMMIIIMMIIIIIIIIITIPIKLIIVIQGKHQIKHVKRESGKMNLKNKQNGCNTVSL